MYTHHRSVGEDDARAHVRAVVVRGSVDEEHTDGLNHRVDIINGGVGLHVVLDQLHGRLQEGGGERGLLSANMCCWNPCTDPDCLSMLTKLMLHLCIPRLHTEQTSRRCVSQRLAAQLLWILP